MSSVPLFSNVVSAGRDCHERAFLDGSARSDELQARPHAHGLRLVLFGGVRVFLWLHKLRDCRGQPTVRVRVDRHPLGVADRECGVRHAWLARKEPLRRLQSFISSGSSTRRLRTRSKMRALLRLFSVSSCRQPPARSSVSWLCRSGLLTGVPPQVSSTAGSCRKSPTSRNRTSWFRDTHAMSAGPCREPVQALHAGPPHVYLRTQWSAVFAPAPRFCTALWVLRRCTTSPRSGQPVRHRVGHVRPAGGPCWRLPSSPRGGIWAYRLGTCCG